MKQHRNLPAILALSTLCMASCDDMKMEWYEDPAHGEVTTAELPLQLAEKISRYKELKSYADFIVGAGVGFDEYMNNEAYRNIVNENFDEIAVGYHMKHGPMVNSKGVINFTNIDAMIAKLSEAGLTVYGHTLVWHQNQNATYLNSLIAPTVIPAPAGSNLLDNGSFEDGIAGWSSWGGAKETVEQTTDEKVDGTGSMKVKVKANAANLWDVEVQCSDIPVIADHRYEITFFIKSEGVGHVRLAFNNMNASYPWVNGAETVTTSGTWQQVVYNASTLEQALTPAEGKSTMNFRFDLGKDPNMTYYIDNIVVVDLDAVVEPTNLLANGKFDTDLTGWNRNNGPDGCNTHVTGSEAFQGGAMKVVNPSDNGGGEWKVQIYAGFTEPLSGGQEYTISYYIRSDAPGSVRCSTAPTAQASYQGNQATSNTWALVTWNLTAQGGETGLNFDLGLKAGTYYIDNVLVTPKEINTRALITRAGPTIIEMSSEDKKAAITAAMEDFISKMVTHYKDKVKAWDVVNEPMNDGSTPSIKTGKNKADLASDEFYWQDYMGDDYAVTAFTLARQYGNPDDVLFINDYNLEYNLNKCDRLITYVQYLESKGAPIDGIGTQMHIDITTNKDNIKQMFQKLAATGKQIKVSELDIKVNTKTPTTEQYAQQAEMYQYVIDMYRQHIPVAQQYGITAWGISDDPKEHVNWIPDDAPNLWNSDYERKHAYKGFADGLAGKDISAEFSGELQY